MEKHLTREKLEQFLKDELSADESVEILLHLDECEKCRNLMPDQDAKKIVKKLLNYEKDETD